jgi:hypothetical protein
LHPSKKRRRQGQEHLEASAQQAAQKKGKVAKLKKGDAC